MREFTCEYDKLCAKVYVGDILHIYYDSCVYTGVVDFQHDTYGITFIYENETGSFMPFSNLHKEIRVIGNVDKHKHLLNVKHYKAELTIYLTADDRDFETFEAWVHNEQEYRYLVNELYGRSTHVDFINK